MKKFLSTLSPTFILLVVYLGFCLYKAAILNTFSYPDALVVFALGALHCVILYLKHIQKPDPIAEIDEKLKGLEYLLNKRIGEVDDKVGKLGMSTITPKVKGKPYIIRNSAVGTIIVYEYLGLLENYEDCCKEIKKLIEEKRDLGKPVHFKPIEKIKLIIGYDFEDVTK